MDTCFVIQPFDKDRFDQRFLEVFEPAIKAAGLIAYRIDKDPSVRIPIEEIEEGIRKSKICFAEVTTDNPNVWYELGYAFAEKKDVVMVTEERTSFPFDIRHRQVINYSTKSKGDFETLEKNITEKLIALLMKKKNVSQIIDTPIKDAEGLAPHEIAMLFVLLENQFTANEGIGSYLLARDMDSAGFTKIASGLALKKLESEGYVASKRLFDEVTQEFYSAFLLTEKGDNWVLKNQDKAQLRKTQSGKQDDLPF